MTSDLLGASPWTEHAGSDITASRIAAEQEQHAGDRLRAVRVVAATAHDSTDARDLLAMLGLSADDIVAAARRRNAAA